MSSRADPVEVDYDNIVASTTLAYLLEIDDRNVWVSKSLILDHDEQKQTIEVPEWFAYQEELI